MMGDKRQPSQGLQQVPEGTALKCYACCCNPAVLFKWMKTPTGGRYQRGWCQECLDSRPEDGDKAGKVRTKRVPTVSAHYAIGQHVAVQAEFVIEGYTPMDSKWGVIVRLADAICATVLPEHMLQEMEVCDD